MVPFYYLRLSHRTLRPVSIGAKGLAFYYAYWYGMRTVHLSFMLHAYREWLHRQMSLLVSCL